MSDIDIRYKGNSIATLDDSGTKTLLTSGKYCEDDISIEYVRPSGLILKPFVLRPDAELIKTFTYDKHIVEDEGVTLPTYSTSAKTLKASAALGETLTLDFNNYDYDILERFLTIPEYSVTTKAKGRDEYHLGLYHFQWSSMPGGTYKALLNDTYFTTRHVYGNAMASYRLCYWSSASAIALYSTSGYGTYQAAVAPTVSNSVATFNSPTFGIRGNTTYFTSTYYNALTDIRYQYVIDVYRSPKNNLNVDGWDLYQMMKHIADCINSANHTLT